MTPETNTDFALRSVLVPTDFSRCCYEALLYVLDIARRHKSNVTLLHVLPPQHHHLLTPQTRDRRLDTAWRDIKKLEANLVAAGHLRDIPHQLLVEHGEIWRAISEVLQREKIDLIVMGTRGRTGLKKLVLGSFAETVFRRAPCPVLTVGPRSRHSTTPVSPPRHILFPTNFSPQSEAAEPYAFSLARSRGAQLTLLNVVEQSMLDHGTDGSPTTEKRLKDATSRLRAVVRHADGRETALKPNLMAEIGSPAEMILKVADKLSVDLIVLGVSPPHELADRLGWTHAYRIVCGARCPVLTVREPFPGPYFEKLFAMNAAVPRNKSPRTTGTSGMLPLRGKS